MLNWLNESAEPPIGLVAEPYLHRHQPAKDGPVSAQLATTSYTGNATITLDHLSALINSLALPNDHADVDMSGVHQPEYTDSDYEPTIRNPTRSGTPSPPELGHAHNVSKVSE